MSWTLECVAPGSAIAGLSEQWHYCEYGAEAGKANIEFGWPGAAWQMTVEREKDRRFVPSWAKQVNGVTFPCIDPVCGYEWARRGTVMTLDELFLVLGKQYSAAKIYSFYRTLRIVALKHRKQRSAHTSASGSATGVTQSPFRAGRVRLEQKPNKMKLLEEYVAANGPEPRKPTKENFDATIRTLYKCLLRDLRRPPFPRLCQGMVCFPSTHAQVICNGTVKRGGNYSAMLLRTCSPT